MPAHRLAARLVVLTALAAVLAGVLPGTAAAADPTGVQSKLEGCKATAGTTLPNGSGQFVCPNANYTTGNLGKFWNELDLVPFRLTLDAGNSAPGTQTYSMAVVFDSEDGTPDRPGYDVISALTLNTALSAASCGAASDTGQQTGANISGGIDHSIYRLITVTQLKNTKCVYDYYGRLALGSHLFPGSALHANLADEHLGGGGSDVSIPVNEIAPQELSKDMSATRGSDHAWSITKGATPDHVDFTNTCADPATLNAQVGVTITWTKLAATPSGDVTVITHVYAQNPAARPIRVKVSDDIRSGTTTIDTANNGLIGTDVPANTELLVLTHTTTVPATTTNLNDLATATYTDVVTGVPIPGTTTATASATVQNTGPVTNASAVITDSESTTGNFLFSANSFLPANIGSFDNGYAGTQTAGPVGWTSVSQSGSSSVTFSKTVYVPAQSSGSGTLSDTATILGSNGFTTNASASVALSAARQATISIVKHIPDVLQGAETAAFTFDILDAGDNVITTRTLNFAAGDTTKSVDVSGITPGAYSVAERLTTGWAEQDPVDVNVTSACTGSAEFTNNFANATAEAHKITQPAGGEAGWTMTLNGPGTGASGEAVQTDANGDASFTTALEEGSYTITETNQTGWTPVGSTGDCSFTVSYPADAGRSFSCTFTNRRPAHAAAVKVTQPAGSESGWTMTLNGPGTGAGGEAVQTDSNGNASFTTDLVAGNYTITETNQSGWTALTPTGDCSFTVAYPADANRTFTCTFTNRRPAHAAAVKVTQPAGSESGWTMTLNGPGTGAGGEAVQTDSNGNASFTTDLQGGGHYTITETNQSGWTALTPTGECDFTVHYPSEAGHTFTCTFTNRRPAHAAAVKVTQPAGDEAGWTMTLNGPGTGASGEAHQTDANGNVAFTTALQGGGHYTITETNRSGWDPQTPTGSCDFTVSYPDDAGRTFTCTFTNVMRPAGAAAVKVTQPAGSESGWTMTLNGPGAGANGESVQTDSNGNASFTTDLEEGDYTITETNQSGWTALTPTGDCSFTVDYPADADRTFTCTFTNRRPAHAAAVKVTQPAGSQAGWTMTLNGPGTGTGESHQTNAGGNVSFTTDLQAGGHYTITETNQSGWTALTPTGECDFTVSYPADAGHTFTCTFTNRRPAHAAAVKVTQPAGLQAGWTVTLKGPGAGANGEAVQTNAAGNASFTTDLQGGGSYTITETNQTGWDPQTPTGSCAFTVSYPADAGRTFTCTFTNVKRALVRVQKTVSGSSNLGGRTFAFELRSGASPTSVGTTLASGTVDATHNPLQFSTSLTPGATYQMCEVLPGIGWMTSLFPNGGFTPNVVNDPLADNSLICHDFTAGAGELKTIAVDNTPPPGGLALTIGYWKNHASCSSSNGKQKLALDITLAAMPIANGQTTHGVYFGALYVDTCLEAVRLLDKSTVNTAKKMASDPAYNMAAQLMAVELNLQGGAGACGGLLAYRAEAQALLTKYAFNGTSSYTSGASKMTAVDQARANFLASQLDKWNNNTLC